MDDDALPPEVYEQLQKADWDALTKNLYAYTSFRLWSVNYPRHTFAPDGQGLDQSELRLARTELGLGQTIQDIVHTVIKKAFSGERRWEPEKIELLPWLRGQIDSEMDHLFKSWNYRNETDPEVKNKEGRVTVETEEPHHHQINEGILSQTLSPEEVQLQNEEQQQIQKAVGRLFEVADDDPELQAVIEIILSGCEHKPKALAEQMGKSVIEINRLLRKLRRRAIRSEYLERKSDD